MVLGQESRRVAIAGWHATLEDGKMPPFPATPGAPTGSSGATERRSFGSRKPVLRLPLRNWWLRRGKARTLHQASQEFVAGLLALLQAFLLRVVRLLLAVAALLDGATAAPLGAFAGFAIDANREAPAIGDVAERRDERALRIARAAARREERHCARAAAARRGDRSSVPAVTLCYAASAVRKTGLPWHDARGGRRAAQLA